MERSAPLLSDLDRERLQSALDRSDQDLTLDDVVQRVLTGEAHLWRGQDATAVTEFVTEMHIWLAGGNLKEIDKLQASAEAYCREIGVSRMTVTGMDKRWVRYLKKHGYKTEITLVKEL